MGAWSKRRTLKTERECRAQRALERSDRRSFSSHMTPSDADESLETEARLE